MRMLFASSKAKDDNSRGCCIGETHVVRPVTRFLDELIRSQTIRRATKVYVLPHLNFWASPAILWVSKSNLPNFVQVQFASLIKKEIIF